MWRHLTLCIRLHGAFIGHARLRHFIARSETRTVGAQSVRALWTLSSESELEFSLVYVMCCDSALTLLVGRQEEHRPVKNWVTGCWCGYQSGARCRLFACGPADVPSSLASFKSRLVLPFCCRLTQVVLEKRPLNGYSSNTSCAVNKSLVWLNDGREILV